jgi:hypothetical protein
VAGGAGVQAVHGLLVSQAARPGDSAAAPRRPLPLHAQPPPVPGRSGEVLPPCSGVLPFCRAWLWLHPAVVSISKTLQGMPLHSAAVLGMHLARGWNGAVLVTTAE